MKLGKYVSAIQTTSLYPWLCPARNKLDTFKNDYINMSCMSCMGRRGESYIERRMWSPIYDRFSWLVQRLNEKILIDCRGEADASWKSN